MDGGEHVWQIANGDSLSDHPNLDELDLPTLGIASRPAALVTRTLPWQHPAQTVGLRLSGLRKVHRRRSLAYRSAFGHDRHPHELHARGQAIYRGRRRQPR